MELSIVDEPQVMCDVLITALSDDSYGDEFPSPEVQVSQFHVIYLILYFSNITRFGVEAYLRF